MISNISVEPQLSRGRLATLVASRFVLNAVFRIAYPLVPFLVLHFGVSVEVATLVVTMQMACGMASLLGGWLAERIGYRATMMCGLGLTLCGTISITIAPTALAVILAYSACGIGVALYQPAMQAYVSVLTPYQQRGRAIGLVELSWALAGIAAIPPLLRLIEAQQSLTGAFLILSGCLVAVSVLTLTTLPTPRLVLPTGNSPSATSSTLIVLRNASVWGMIAFLFLGIGGNEVLFIAQAPWASARFGATPSDLGTAAFVFGLGELVGSLGSALFTDRLGKRRAAVSGFAAAALVYLALPLVSISWGRYLFCYLLFAICVEFAIVAALTLASTVSNVGRATVMAFTVTAVQLSRALASLVGVAVLNASSIMVNGVIAAMLTLLGVGVALRFVRENERFIAHDTV